MAGQNALIVFSDRFHPILAKIIQSNIESNEVILIFSLRITDDFLTSKKIGFNLFDLTKKAIYIIVRY